LNQPVELLQQPVVEPIGAPDRMGKLAQVAARWALFLYIVAVVCPIRYWNVEPSVDNTWVFALNYGAAHGLSGLVWTTGPLGYLMLPQDIGGNLAQALVFQMIVWLVLVVVFADLFFIAGFRLRNLAAFSVFFGLSAPLFWFNYYGIENLVVAAVLVLLVVARWRGGLARYLGALVLTGLVPLIKLPAGIIAGGAVAGFVFDAMYRRRPGFLRDFALAVTVPVTVAVVALRSLLPSFAALVQYIKGGLELSGNYSVAMTVQGDPIEFAAAAETMVWIGVLLYIAAKTNRQLASFTAALLAIPLFLNFKHAFVRQDIHVINFFCFAAMALALIALTMSIEKRAVAAVLLIMLPYGIIWLEYTIQRFNIDSISQASAFAPMHFAYHALVRNDVSASLKAETDLSFPPETRVEPEILAVVGKSPVASMGLIFNSALPDGLNLQVYPVIQRAGTYTPYLDGLNAAWIRDQGPAYLIADWDSIDKRQVWGETPAMWLEVYRWYDTRSLGKRHLLLQRRSAPRFERLVSKSRFETRFADGLEIPASTTPVLWSLDCRLSATGSLQKTLFRIPEVLMTIDGQTTSRVIPEVLTSPVMGNFLPNSLSELSALMTPSAESKAPVKKLTFGGPGLSAYAPVCQAALWSLQ
jgi:hypothetical protein